MTNDTRDIGAFTRVIEELDIEVSQSSDGVFTACTTSEPLFCYDADTQEALSALVADTLVSYAKHFYNLEGLIVNTTPTPLDDLGVPIERSNPVARITPTFDLAA